MNRRTIVRLSTLVPMVALATCSGVTDVIRSGMPPGGVAELQITAPSRLAVGDHALITVWAADKRGSAVPLPASATWSSSDSTVAAVTADGVVSGRRRGVATIELKIPGRSARATVLVEADLAIGPAFLARNDYKWFMVVGDTLHLAARYVDVNGDPVPEQPSVVWTSSNPGAVSVTPGGVATAVGPGTNVVIRADAEDVSALLSVNVVTSVPGKQATLRLAHVVPGLGPITFVPTSGPSVTLSFGESVEREVPPETVGIEVKGFPGGSLEYYESAGGPFEPGSYLSVYAVGDASRAYLVSAWSSHSVVASDSGLVRLVQGSGFGVAYLVAQGAAADGTPQLCYFDPTDVSEYYQLGAGAFDVLLAEKYGGGRSARLPATAGAGHATTLVLYGGPLTSAGAMVFRDP